MLEEQRSKIDQIDRQLVELFEQRTKTVEEVAQIKWEHGMEILDTNRENQVIEKVQGYLKDPSLKDELADFYTNLMRISRSHQEEWMKTQE